MRHSKTAVLELSPSDQPEEEEDAQLTEEQEEVGRKLLSSDFGFDRVTVIEEEEYNGDPIDLGEDNYITFEGLRFGPGLVSPPTVRVADGIRSAIAAQANYKREQDRELAQIRREAEDRVRRRSRSRYDDDESEEEDY